MARLYLKLDDEVLGEYLISSTPVTIGRLPDNTIHIDHLSVSGRHARIDFEDGKYLLLDEKSTNGTYMNGQRVKQAVLTSGDTVHVGRHILHFVNDANDPVPIPMNGESVAAAASVNEPFVPEYFPSSESGEKMLVASDPVVPEVFSSKAAAKKVGVVSVVSGKTDQLEYVLASANNIIGKSEAASIRLTRWFAPREAATIQCRDGKYFLSESHTATPVRVNSEAVRGERELQPGDTIMVEDVTFTFNLQ
jgi:pSer/pThr/pTyr-binding forkhead associated (FHA) protein